MVMTIERTINNKLLINLQNPVSNQYSTLGKKQFGSLEVEYKLRSK